MATSLLRRHCFFCNHSTFFKSTRRRGRQHYSSFSSSSLSNNNIPAPKPSSSPSKIITVQPIDFTTSSTISGDESQILQVRIQPNQILRAESGSMLFMTDGVRMETSMGGSSSSSQLLSTGMTRLMTGQSYSNSNNNNYNYGTVCLGTDFPAKILKLQLNHYPNSTLICQKGAYMAGSHSIIMEMAFTKTFTGGFFGGEGFVLQKLRGKETVFLKAYGTVVKKTLRSNETLRVSSGSLVAMTSTIDYDVTMMSGFKNVLFGGEGLFITTLTGPGTVWLQGMPIDRMVSEIARRVPSGGGIGLGIPIGGVGGGSSSSEENAVEDGEENVDGDTDAGGVPLSDDVIDADRNATVASSGMMSSEDDSPPHSPHNHDQDDPESSESLFGDAAYGDGGELPRSFETTMEEDEFAMPQEEGGDIMSEFEEPTISDEQFEDDGTTFSTYDSNTSQGSEIDAPATPDQDGESSLLGQLWDLFKDFNDDD
ncbi:hypothetical protein ACHAWC_010733 [Mediolabrus comicus]